MKQSYVIKSGASLALGVAALLVANLASAANELNPYSPQLGNSHRHGVLPTREVHANMQAWLKAHNAATNTVATGNETLSYGGGVNGIGVTSGTPKVYIVVYGSQWGTAGTNAAGNMTLSADTLGAVPYLESMYKGLGTGGELWSGVMTQYCDGPGIASGAKSCPATGVTHVGYPTGGAFAGIWYDNATASPSAATGTQLAQEAVRAAAHFGNTTAASNRYAQYVILSPKGTKPDGFNTPQGGFCAWHDYTGDYAGVNSPYGDIAFHNMPFVADLGTSCGQGSVNGNTAQGKLDGFSIVDGHEYAELITDQNPAGGWTNHTGDATYDGQENADECSWITTGAQAATQNVTMGNGTYAMQSTWSNDTNACNISHAIVTGSTGGTPNCDSGIINGASLSCTAAGLPNYTGTAYSHVYSTYSGGGACTQVAAPGYDTSGCVPPVGTVLTSGTPVTGINLAAGASNTYTIVVPGGQTSLTIDTSGGSGDADLYVQLGSAPTTSSYLQKSDGATTTEHIAISNPAAGTYYVMVKGYAASSNVSLVATYSVTQGNVLSNGVPVTGLAGSSGSSKMYTMVVPAGRSSLTFKTSGGSGDADLYVKLGSAPTTSSYLKRSNGSTTAETISITSPAAGTYYVMVYGYSTYSGVSLVGQD